MTSKWVQFKIILISPQLSNIYETSIYVLKLVMHDYKMLNYSPNVLVGAVFG